MAPSPNPRAHKVSHRLTGRQQRALLWLPSDGSFADHTSLMGPCLIALVADFPSYVRIRPAEGKVRSRYALTSVGRKMQARLIEDLKEEAANRELVSAARARKQEVA